jgi:hypothetical protein
MTLPGKPANAGTAGIGAFFALSLALGAFLHLPDSP